MTYYNKKTKDLALLLNAGQVFRTANQKFHLFISRKSTLF